MFADPWALHSVYTQAAHEAQARNVAERLAEARAELAAADAARPSTDAESTHELRAIVVHSGTVDAGHYYAYIRVAGSWYLFNDFVRKARGCLEWLVGTRT